METFECIEKRRSVRRYIDSPVEWEKIGNILRAAQLAPSSGNSQDVRLVVVTDRKKRERLAEACMKQLWMARAPVHIVIYSDPKNTKRFYGLRGEKLYSIQNSAVAAQNILLAATDQGLASCWVGAFDETMLNNVLGAPDSARPQAVITVGYSEDDPEMPKRYKLWDLTFINGYGSKIVNVDLVFDDYSEVLRKKIKEAKEVAVEKGPVLGQKLLEKGKEKLKKVQEKMQERAAEKQKKKEKALEKELGEEEAVLDDTEDMEDKL
ncbi:TPA: hypothetical protein HA265_00345 [Candidatus Woesearchaeota archaeon]|nr:hypothetical protein [Candidatus Woesearchaeota archaeon]